MSTENDVPLGEGSQRYYEQLFGDRIRQINKADSARQADNSGSNNSGRLGCGVMIAAFFLIRLFTTFLNTHSHSSTHSPPHPSPPPFRVQQPNVGHLPVIDARDEDMRRFLDQFREDKEAAEEKPIRIQPENRVPPGAKR
ncbi:MAG TPA: hypothetical protein VH592_14785 [Gemmataceae bacterium]